jgi:hypothetical protein
LIVLSFVIQVGRLENRLSTIGTQEEDAQKRLAAAEQALRREASSQQSNSELQVSETSTIRQQKSLGYLAFHLPFFSLALSLRLDCGLLAVQELRKEVKQLEEMRESQRGRGRLRLRRAHQVQSERIGAF